MFKKLLIETAINTLIAALQNPEKSKILDFIFSEKIQEKVAEVFTLYTEGADKYEELHGEA